MKRSVISFAQIGLFALVGPGACGGDAGHDPVTFDLPTAVSRGGPVLSAPRIQTIYFPGFPYQGAIDGFLASLAQSHYWTDTTAEYGVGRPTVLASDASPVAVPAAITVNDIRGLLEQAQNEHATALGPPRGDTIYTLFFAPDTKISGSGFTLCDTRAPSAFHGELPLMQTLVPVIVIPTCSTFAGHSELTGAAALTPALSHELVEAATDPFPSSAPAFVDTDDRHAMWSIALSGGEVADLCENEAPNLVTPGDVGYPVQRIWSNVAARGTGGPCVPVPAGEAYFNAVARLPDIADFQRDRATTTFPLPVVHAPLGGAAGVTVDFESADPALTWFASAIEIQSESDGGGMYGPRVEGRAGDTKALTVGSAQSPPSGDFPLLVLSHSTSGAVHLWVGAVSRR
jgi:hypothetical protein